MHRLLLLGTFGVESPDGLLVTNATQRRPAAVLAALAVAGARGCTREQLTALLWSECDDLRARHHLSDAIYALHKDLGHEIVEATPALVRLGPGCTSDVMEFRAALTAGEREAAVALYRGPFLDGFHVPASLEFDEWLSAERLRLRAQFLDALEALAHAEELLGHARAAVVWWERLVQEDPFNSRFAVSLARLYTLAGDRGHAVRILEAHRRVLRDELGVDTGPDIRIALDEVRAGKGKGGGFAARVSPSATAAVPAPEPSPLLVPAVTAAVAHRWRAAVRQNWGLALGFVSGIALILLTAGILSEGRTAGGTFDPDLIAIPPFVVVGLRADAVWSEGLPNLLQGKLDGAGSIRIASPGLMSRFGPVPSADQTAMQRLAVEAHAGIVLAGTAVRSGEGVRAYVAIYDAQSRRLAFEYDLADDETRLDRLADAIAVRLLTDLVHSRALATARYTSLGSTSPAAIKAFLRGEAHLRRLQLDSARAFYELAVTTDSGFALAWRGLAESRMRDHLRPRPAALLHAGAHNHGLAERESLLLAADSLLGAMLQSGGRARQGWAARLLGTLDTAVQLYAEDADAWYRLGKARLFAAAPLGLDLDAVRAPLARAVGLDTGLGAAYLQLARVDFLRDRPDLARRSIATLVSFGPSGRTGAGLRLLDRLLAQQSTPAGTRDVLDSLRLPLRSGDADAEVRAIADSLASPPPDSTLVTQVVTSRTSPAHRSTAVATASPLRRPPSGRPPR